jgi:DNA polymerase I-like protein with 3'-5' exonuclease and polymerase domains
VVQLLECESNMARFDEIGLFWEDARQVSMRGTRMERPMPAFIETGWTPPTSFPNLAAAKVIAVDTETWDPDLLDMGPGWGRGKGHIVGVSVAVTGHSWYFPIRHETQKEMNMNPDHVFAWLRDTMSNPHQAKVGANLTYDLGWLQTEGVDLAGELLDVQYAEALLDESSQVSLDLLGFRYLDEGKTSNQLYGWLDQWFGGGANSKQRKHIHRAPPSLVGPYAQGDADLPLRLLPIMAKKLNEEGLLDLFRMECGLMRLMVAMRMAGARVDIPKAERLRDSLKVREEALQKEVDYEAGFKVNINTGASLAKLFDKVGLAYPKTAKGAPSFTKEVFDSTRHPIADKIKQIRKLAKLRGTFVESYVLDSHINGKVHGQFHLLRSDEGGTRSGRFSSSTPNLQNLPSRDEELAPLVRGIFVPDIGHIAWRKYDYSQIEYRFMIHYAVGPGSDEARRLFNAEPDTDYHEMALDLVAPQAGWDISTPEMRKQRRRPIKNINFGLIYGMGVDKLSRDLGLSSTEGRKLFKAYHKGVPFAKPTMDQLSELAKRTGVVTTILGRKSRFDLWGPRDVYGEAAIGLPYPDAMHRYGGNVERAYTHKALNRRLQGSAADLMKKAMHQCWIDGIFNETGVPRLTVHDELDFSDPGGKDAAFLEMKRIMETAIPLSIPVRADMDIGADWGSAG